MIITHYYHPTPPIQWYHHHSALLNQRNIGTYLGVHAAGKTAHSSLQVFWAELLHPPSDGGNTSSPSFGVPEVSQAQTPAQTPLRALEDQADRTATRKFLSCLQIYYVPLWVCFDMCRCHFCQSFLTICWQSLPGVLALRIGKFTVTYQIRDRLFRVPKFY